MQCIVVMYKIISFQVFIIYELFAWLRLHCQQCLAIVRALAEK